MIRSLNHRKNLTIASNVCLNPQAVTGLIHMRAEKSTFWSPFFPSLQRRLYPKMPLLLLLLYIFFHLVYYVLFE